MCVERYIYPHDEQLKAVLEETAIGTSQSWKMRGECSFPVLRRQLRQFLTGYKIKGRTLHLAEELLRQISSAATTPLAFSR